MIVFLDMQNQNVLLYTDKGLKKISFKNVDSLKHMVGSQPILYITNAMSTNAVEITALVKSQLGQIPETGGINPEEMSTGVGEPLFVRYVGKKGKGKKPGEGGLLHVQDIDETFYGPVDFKPLEYMIKKGFETSSIAQHLLKKGSLEIIPLSEMQKIRLDWDRNHNKDEELDDMLIPTESTARDHAEKLKSGEIKSSKNQSNDPIEIDLNKTFSFKKGTAGSSSNEDTLVPADYQG